MTYSCDQFDQSVYSQLKVSTDCSFEEIFSIFVILKWANDLILFPKNGDFSFFDGSIILILSFNYFNDWSQMASKVQCQNLTPDDRILETL